MLGTLIVGIKAGRYISVKYNNGSSVTTIPKLLMTKETIF